MNKRFRKKRGKVRWSLYDRGVRIAGKLGLSWGYTNGTDIDIGVSSEDGDRCIFLWRDKDINVSCSRAIRFLRRMAQPARRGKSGTEKAFLIDAYTKGWGKNKHGKVLMNEEQKKEYASYGIEIVE